MAQIPPFNLPPEALPWARAIQSMVQDLSDAAARGDQSDLNANKAQNSSISLLSESIVDLNSRVQDAIGSITIAAAQVVSGVFDPARIPTLPSSMISGTWTNDVVATNVTATSVFATNAGLIAGNITASRTSTWARNSDGYIGNTLSSIEFKQLVEGVDGPDPLKILQWSNKYYYYLAELELQAADPDYHLQLEWGPIAEELHELGLWQVVVYEDHVKPISVQHPLFGQLAIEATKYVWEQHQALAAEVAAIKSFINYPDPIS